jgi:uncharacterized delta-60 repeat protein
VRAFVFLLIAIAAPKLALSQAGQLDNSFGTGGIFATTFSQQFGFVFGTSVALQANGKLIVGGSAGNPGVVLRLNTNGTLDSTFASGGIFSIRYRDVQNITVGVGVQSSQKIVAVGTGLPGGGQLIRLNSDGSQDTTFGNGGSVFLNQNPSVLALQPDDKIIVISGGNGSANSTMMRFTVDGQPDSTFGSGGTAPLVTGASAIALQSDGKILTASGSLIRYNTNGSLDTSFGINGQVADLASAAAVGLESNGLIVTGGSITSSLSLSGNTIGFGLTEFLSGGFPVFLFGTHGGEITPFPGFGSASISSLRIQPNSSIVTAGTASTSAQNSVFALARYLPTGTLDNSFGSGGKVTTSFGNTTAAISAIALQSDGKIVAVGTVGFGGSELVVVRYLAQ